MPEQPTTAFHRTMGKPPAYKRLPTPDSYGRWEQSTADPRARLNQYELGRLNGSARFDPLLERALERRTRRRERDGRLGPPPPIM